MGFLQDTGQIRETSGPDSGFLQQAGITSLAPTKTSQRKDTSTRTTTTTSIPTRKAIQTPKKETFISKIGKTFGKIGDTIKYSLVTPRIVSPVPEKPTGNAFTPVTPTQPQEPITIEPNQKKLSQPQLQNVIGTGQTTISQAPKRTLWQKIADKVGEAFDSRESKIARAGGAYALQKTEPGSKYTLAQLEQKGGNPLKNTVAEEVTKELGIRNTKTTSEIATTAFEVAIALGLASAPVATAISIATFTAVNEIKSGLISAIKGDGFKLGANQTLSDLFENAPPDVKNILDVVDFMIVAKGSHATIKNSPKTAEMLTKDFIETYNAPKTINIPAAEVRKILIDKGGKQETDLIKSLGLSSKEWRSAVQEGITIEVPAEKIVYIADKPYWAKIKEVIGKEPLNKVVVTRAGETTSRQSPKGLLEAGEKTPEQIIGEVISSGKENTPEGKELIKIATEAKKTGQNVLIEDIGTTKPQVETPLPSTTKAKESGGEAITGTEKAKDYITAEDFAEEVYSTTPDKQIGTIDANKITPRDEIGKDAEYEKLKADIEKNGIKEPVRVTVEKDGKILTTDGSQRTAIAQELGIDVPIIVNEGKIEGLKTIKEIYEQNKKVEEPKATKTEDALLQEARKYKSADEFVKAQGKPLYHGSPTDRLNTGIKGDYATPSDAGKGIYFTDDPVRASDYANVGSYKEGYRGSVTRAHLIMKNPLEIEGKFIDKKIVADAKAKGFDGIINKNVEGIRGYNEYVVFDLSQIKTKSQLTDIYNQANKVEVKPKKKIVTKPQEQLPVGEGEKRASRHEARVKGIQEDLKNLPKEEIEKLGLSNYKSLNNKEGISNAIEYVSKNPEEALQVLQGSKETPKGLLRNAIYIAMERESLGNVELARKLASLESTRYGQEIQILREIDKDSPASILSDIIEVRRRAIDKRYKSKTIKQVRKQMAKQIKEKVKVPKRDDWNAFIKSIEC